MEADEVGRVGAQVLAERRPPPLALAQLALGGEGQLRERATALDARAVERRARLEVVELVAERAHAATGSLARTRPRAASSPATTSAAPATARAVIASP